MPAHAPILVVTDPTAEAQPACARAADFATRTGAPLTLLACVFDPFIAGEQLYPGFDLRKLRRAALDHQLAGLRRIAEPLRRQGLQVACRAVFDHPLHEGIIREAMRIEAGMVVKDTHHHGALARSLFTNTDWHLVRECPTTLWLVKPVTPAAPATVVAAVDPVHANDKPATLDREIIRTAQEFAVLYEERLHLVHAIAGQVPGPGAALTVAAAIPPSIQPELEAHLRRDHATALDRLAADVGFPAEQVHLRRGEPGEVLPRLAAELRAGVLVLGAVSRSRLRRAFIGNTAERVLEAVPCDVVIVKPEGFHSPVSPRGRAVGYMARTSH